MGFLSFTCLKAYFYFLIYWIIDLSITIVRDIFLDEEIKELEYLKGTEFIYISCLSVSDLLAGFLVMRTYRKMKSINTQEKQQEKKNEVEKGKSGLTQELIYNDLSIRNHKYSYLFLISLLEFIARCTDLFYILFLNGAPIRIGEVNWLISIDTFARIFFSKIILKKQLYKHHYFSIILIIIGLFSMSVCAFEAIAQHESQNWPYFLFVSAKYIILPFEDVINKILLTDEFLLPHYLMFWRGIFTSFFVGALSLIVLLPHWVEFHYFDQFTTDWQIAIQVIMKVLYTIFSFFKAFCLLKILDIFSPQHVAFSNTAFSIFQLVKCRTKSHDGGTITTFDFIFLSIIVFATLVFNEVIIINAFGLNQNTQKGFIKKANLELQDLGKSYDSDDENNSGDEEDNKNENLNSTNTNENLEVTGVDGEKNNNENNNDEKIDNQDTD